MPPTYTQNLNLAKPDLDDQYNVDIWNSNSDIIDEFAGRIPPRAYTADKLTSGANINGVLFKGDRDVVTGWGWYYSTVNYAQNNIVFTVIGNEVKVKRSLQDENMGHPLTDVNWWADVELGGGQSAAVVEDIGTIKFSLSPVRSDNLHLLNGDLITDIPVDFADYITWLRSNAPNCFISQADYDNQLSLYGECGHFVYNTEFNTIRLPKITGIVQGTNTLNALGNIIQAGLPSISHTHTRGTMNITGSLSGTWLAQSSISGAFSSWTQHSKNVNGVQNGTNIGKFTLDFDASNGWTGSTSTNSAVSSIYGRSNTVQPQTIQGFYYIVYTNLGINQDTFINIIENKADKTYVDNQMAIVDQTYAKKEDIAKVYDFKGNVATYNDLPDIDYEKVGNVYNVLDTGKNYAVATDNLDVKFWDDIGGDLTNYYTKQQVYNKTEVDAKLLEIETGQADVVGQVASIVNGKFEFTDGLNTTDTMNTTVNVSSSNPNLQVTSTYTGHQSSEGTLKYEFTYDGENWLINEQIANLEVYDLVVIGTPVENDTITLTYLTLNKSTISVDSTNSYSSSGIKPITGTGVAAALSTITPQSIGALPDTTVIPTITNTYSASSSDGMSGIAVASAISDLAKTDGSNLASGFYTTLKTAITNDTSNIRTDNAWLGFPTHHMINESTNTYNTAYFQVNTMYQAPKNGWITFVLKPSSTSGSVSYYEIFTSSTGAAIQKVALASNMQGTYDSTFIMIPIRKDYYIKITAPGSIFSYAGPSSTSYNTGYAEFIPVFN